MSFDFQTLADAIDSVSYTHLSDDYTVYTFHLRDGLKWSDGQALTAHDFEYGAYCLLNQLCIRDRDKAACGE